MMYNTLVHLFVVFYLTVNLVWSKEAIHVSRFGIDSKTCGTQTLPCRTISYAIHQVSEGGFIYLDGTSTSKNPYDCQPLDPGHLGIYLTKSISFVGMRTRAYISCPHRNQWLVNGIKHKDRLAVSFHGLAFQNTSLVVFDALVDINDSLFLDSEHVSLNFTIFNLSRFELALNNVVFERNAMCMSIENTARIKMFIYITNATFVQNGKDDFYCQNLPSILRLNSRGSDISIDMRNCNFSRNSFDRYGMISLENEEGMTNLSLHKFTFKGNGHRETLSGIPHGIFLLQSAMVIMTMEFGFVYSTFGNFLTAYGQTAQINVLNIELDEFYSPSTNGGALNITGSLSGFLSIKDSCFRNGKSNSWGGVVAITAPKLSITIQNCTFHNMSSHDFGGAVYVYSISRSPNSSNSFVTVLNIRNSSFLNSSSGQGGAVHVFVEKLFATITDCFFVRNIGNDMGGALAFYTLSAGLIRLDNVHFIENIAGDGGIVVAIAPYKESTFILTTNNVSFVGNKLRTEEPHYSGIFYLLIKSSISSFVFKFTRFFHNIGLGSSLIAALLETPTTSHFVTLDTCTFRENVANIGSLLVDGQATVICKHSIFDSNGNFDCRQSYGFYANMKNSNITITSSKFVNSSCGAVYISINNNSSVKIEHSMFVRNRAKGTAGGAMYIFVIPKNDLSQAYVKRSENAHHNVLVEKVSFENNTANSGSVLTIINGKVKVLNCMFTNNYARFQGGQIASFGSTDMKIFHSVFKQTITKIKINKTEFITSSFLKIYSTGELLLRNTTVDLDVISEEHLISATRADRVNIGNSSVINCPLGSALKKTEYSYKDSAKHLVTTLNLYCQECNYNFYSMQRGHAKGLDVDNSFKCLSCPRGANCIPIIKSKRNFWGYYASLNPPALAFTLCPFGYCKSPKPSSSKFNDCHGKRTGVMCGSCSDGYTEALWSTYCTSTKDCNDYWFWILFLVLVLFMAVLLIFKPPFIAYSLKHILWFKIFITNTANSREFRYNNMTRNLPSYQQNNRALISTRQPNEDKRQFSSYLEIVFYFYQIAQLLLSSYALDEFFDSKILPPVLGFFNFEPRLHKISFLCPFPGLTPKSKFAFRILPVFGTILAIFIIYCFQIIISKRRRSQPPPVPSYLQACIKTIFLGYTTLATVGISLIRCVSAAGEDRWFYNGNIICYQWWQYVSFAFNGIFVIPLIFVLAWVSFKVHQGKITVKQFLLAIAFPLPFLLLWLFRTIFPSPQASAGESENVVAIQEMLLGPYKEPGYDNKYGAMYWQSVLIARRFILVLIFCTVTEPSIKLFCMTLACVFVLFFHLKIKPFRNALANNLESLSLLLLVMLGLINLFKSVFVGFEGIVKGPLITVFKVFYGLEIVILGLFPAAISLLVCLTIFSLILRVLFICCRSSFKCILRCSGQTWRFRDTNRLAHFCEATNE